MEVHHALELKESGVEASASAGDYGGGSCTGVEGTGSEAATSIVTAAAGNKPGDSSTRVYDVLPYSPSATIYDNGNTHWLNLKFVEAAVKMDCNLTPLQFAQHVLKKLRAVEDMDDFYETEWDEGAFFYISSIR